MTLLHSQYCGEWNSTPIGFHKKYGITWCTKRTSICLFFCCHRNPTKIYKKIDKKTHWQTDSCFTKHVIMRHLKLEGSHLYYYWILVWETLSYLYSNYKGKCETLSYFVLKLQGKVWSGSSPVWFKSVVSMTFFFINNFFPVLGSKTMTSYIF